MSGNADFVNAAKKPPPGEETRAATLRADMSPPANAAFLKAGAKPPMPPGAAIEEIKPPTNVTPVRRWQRDHARETHEYTDESLDLGSPQVLDFIRYWNSPQQDDTAENTMKNVTAGAGSAVQYAVPKLGALLMGGEAIVGGANALMKGGGAGDVAMGAAEALGATHRAFSKAMAPEASLPSKMTEHLYERWAQMPWDEKKLIKESAEQYRQQAATPGKLERPAAHDANMDAIDQFRLDYQKNGMDSEGGQALTLIERIGSAMAGGMSAQDILKERARFGLPETAEVNEDYVRRAADLYQSMNYTRLYQAYIIDENAKATDRAKGAATARGVGAAAGSLASAPSWGLRGAAQLGKDAGMGAKIVHGGKKALGVFDTTTYLPRLGLGGWILADFLDDGKGTVREVQDTAEAGAALAAVASPSALLKGGALALGRFFRKKAEEVGKEGGDALNRQAAGLELVVDEGNMKTPSAAPHLQKGAAVLTDAPGTAGIANLVPHSDDVAAAVLDLSRNTSKAVGKMVSDNRMVTAAKESEMGGKRWNAVGSAPNLDRAAQDMGGAVRKHFKALKADVSEKFYQQFDDDYGDIVLNENLREAAGVADMQEPTLATLREMYSKLGKAANAARGAGKDHEAYSNLVARQQAVADAIKTQSPEAWAVIEDGNRRFAAIQKVFRPHKQTAGSEILHHLLDIGDRGLQDVGANIARDMLKGGDATRTAQRFTALARALGMGQGAKEGQVLADVMDMGAGSQQAARLLANAMTDADIIRLNTALRSADAQALPEGADFEALQKGMDIITAEGFAALDRIAKGAASAPGSADAAQWAAKWQDMTAQDVVQLRHAVLDAVKKGKTKAGITEAALNDFLQGAAMREALSGFLHLSKAAEPAAANAALIEGLENLLGRSKEARAKFDAIFPAIEGQKTTPRARFEYLLNMVGGADYLESVVMKKGVSGKLDPVRFMEETHGAAMRALRPLLGLPVSVEYTAASSMLTYLRRFIGSQHTEQTMKRLGELVYQGDPEMHKAVDGLMSKSARAVRAGARKLVGLLDLSAQFVVPVKGSWEGATQSTPEHTREEAHEEVRGINPSLFAPLPAAERRR